MIDELHEDRWIIIILYYIITIMAKTCEIHLSKKDIINDCLY